MCAGLYAGEDHDQEKDTERVGKIVSRIHPSSSFLHGAASHKDPPGNIL